MMIHIANSSNVCDTLIVGGGVLGLWAARHAIKRGEKVMILEKRQVGAGASGGFLGALMPHMPDSWNAKKQFQFDGLDSLAGAVAVLEDETGVDCCYRRCGRLIPFPHEKMASHMPVRSQGAVDHWLDRHEMRWIDQSEASKYDGWLSGDFSGYGAQYDTLSARINPRLYLEALAVYARQGASLIEGEEVCELLPLESAVVLQSGEKISAARIVVASGWEAYPLLQPFMGAMNAAKPIGRGVKGQAVLVDFEHGDDLPIVYHDGVYVVPHAGNRVAIGSTSINNWQETGHLIPDAFDPDDMGFYERALELVPALKSAEIVDRWAAVRPRNTLEGRGTDPFFGSIPDHENVIALVGGFKITLGIAHIVDRVL